MHEPDRSFEVVFLCTGNQFRSPLAAELLRRSTQGLRVRVRSLGTLEVASAGTLPEALYVGRELGLDLSGHRSCSLEGLDLSEADLVVGFELHHMAKAVIDARADRRKTFLLPELVGYLERLDLSGEADPVERAAHAVRGADELRARLGSPPAVEIADPAGGSDKDYGHAGDRVADYTLRLSRLLFETP